MKIEIGQGSSTTQNYLPLHFESFSLQFFNISSKLYKEFYVSTLIEASKKPLSFW